MLPGGIDAKIFRSDGAMTLDVRLVLSTHDKALIYMHYTGLRYGPQAVMRRIAAGEEVDIIYAARPTLKPPPGNTTGSTASSP